MKNYFFPQLFRKKVNANPNFYAISNYYETFYIVLFFLISSCTEHKINYYKNETPKINLNEFFNGKLLAHGIVQDRSGKVIKRFKVDIKVSWKDDIATLDEKFVY